MKTFWRLTHLMTTRLTCQNLSSQILSNLSFFPFCHLLLSNNQYHMHVLHYVTVHSKCGNVASSTYQSEVYVDAACMIARFQRS